MSRSPMSRSEWFKLVVTSGLAAMIAALAGIVGEFVREGRQSDVQQCQLAAGVLQDDTLQPYFDAAARQRVLAAAAARFQSCMKE